MSDERDPVAQILETKRADVQAVDVNRAELGLDHPQQRQRSARLAGSAAPNNAASRARLDAEADVVEREWQMWRVAKAEVRDLDRAAARWPGCRWSQAIRRLLLEVDVLADPLDRGHLELERGEHTDGPLHARGEDGGEREHEAGLSAVEALMDDGDGGRERGEAADGETA